MVSRKKLLKEPDEFITISGKLIAFGTRYRKELAISACIILALVAGISAMRYFNEKKELTGFAALNAVTTQYKQLKTDKTAEEAFSAVKTDFEKLLNDFGGKTAGKIGRVVFAGICRDAGQYDQAQTLYQKALDTFADDPFYGPVVQMNLGHTAVAKGDLDQAKANFEKIIQSKDTAVAAEALFNLGVIYEKNGDTAKARDLFQRIVDEHEQSIFSTLAAEKAKG